MRDNLSQNEVQEKCRLWQQRLRLADWDVEVKIVARRDISSSCIGGEVEWLLDDKTANIKLLDVDDYPKDALRPSDMEKTLVHELLHLLVAPFDAPSGTAEALAQEQMINAVAGALIQLSRDSGI